MKGNDIKLIDKYQLRQFFHDEQYHADILSLGLSRRLIHIGLHLAKYSYSLSLARNSEQFNKSYIDAFIMTVSAANALNIRLCKSKINSTDQRDTDFLQSYLKYVSVFCKVCESEDHREECNSHVLWKTSIISLYNLFKIDSQLNHINLIEGADNRLSSVECKIKDVSIKHQILRELGDI